jgi:hypothetical protein
MDQSRGSAASSNSLSAPLRFLCWTGRCESGRPSHHAKFKPRRRGIENREKSPSQSKVKAGKRRRKPFFSFFSFFFSRLERCSQCTAIRTQTLDQAGTGDQSSIDSSISNREKTESRRGQLSSNWLNPLWWPAPSLAHS